MSERSRSGSPVYTTGAPASSVRAMAATLGCAAAASTVSSHRQLRSARANSGSLRGARAVGLCSWRRLSAALVRAHRALHEGGASAEAAPQA